MVRYSCFLLLLSFSFFPPQTRSLKELLIWILIINAVRDSSLASPLIFVNTPFLDVVWSELKQIGLIDSIFRNFYIPPIIFGNLLYSSFST